jgi:hypothetical protein
VSIWTRAFWQAALERAVKTAAQAAILILAAEQINVLVVNWVEVAGFAAGGFVLSALTSVASNHIGPTPGPSVATEHVHDR